MARREQSNTNTQTVSPAVKKIKDEMTTNNDFIVKLMRNKETNEAIIKKYFDLPEDERAAMINNRRVFRLKNNFKLASQFLEIEEIKRLREIKRLIKSEERKYTRKLIKLPKESNERKPIVIVNPGFGFDEPGAVTRDEHGKLIEGKNLNANMAGKLTRELLREGFEVYLVYDLKYYGIELPKKDPSLHILFKGRPPIEGERDNCRMADASAFGIKQIMIKVKENNENADIASVCIHHNWYSKKYFSGFISFYRVGKTTSENFEKNSKNLAERFAKNCKNIYNNKSDLKTDDWVVCGFGSSNEKEEKVFDDEAATFLELGFMSNPAELKKILNPDLQDLMAKKIAHSLYDYFVDKKNGKFKKIFLKNYKNTFGDDEKFNYLKTNNEKFKNPADVLLELNLMDTNSNLKKVILHPRLQSDISEVLTKSLDDYLEK